MNKSGTTTYSAVGTSGITDGGTASTLGQVINLSASSLSASAINTATGLVTANNALAVASNSASYLFATGAADDSTVTDTLSNFQNVVGSGGRDYIVGSATANVITGGAGADTLTGGDGIDRFVQNEGNSVANTAIKQTDGTTDAVDGTKISESKIIFGNKVDIITDFAATDTLNGDIFTAATLPTVVGAATTFGDITDNTGYIIYGTWDASTGIFTAAAAFNASSAKDAAVTYSDAADIAGATNTSYVILDNLTAALASANFV